MDPDDLWFRADFIKELWSILEKQHVILVSPRRTGKTSVMDSLVENPEREFSPVSVFVQDLDHPGDFILTLLDAFYDRHPSLFHSLFNQSTQLVGKVLDQIKEVGVSGFKIALRETDSEWEKNWKKHGDDFFQRVREHGSRVLFVVDEFPDFIINMKKYHPELVSTFLSWFRGHRLKPHPKQDQVRWLLGGSVNLSSTLDSMGCLDEVNDFHSEPLPVLTHVQIIEFVTRMLQGRGVEMSKNVPEVVAGRIGRPVPLFLQMLTQDLYRIWKKENRPLEQKDVERAFDDLVTSSAAREKLQHFYSRIRQYYIETKRSAAYDLLSRLAVSESGLEREELMSNFLAMHEQSELNLPGYEQKQVFNELLCDLENDFYVSEVSPDRYDFSSGVMKAWWRKYYA